MTDNDARVGSTKGLVFRLSYTHIFSLPAEFGVGPLVVTPLVYRIYSWDTELNPLVSPTLLGSTIFSSVFRRRADAPLCP